ncbi:MAG TPA: fasciclin domain-containing protein [Candidatus Saccharimonadales bacterium]|nr:fasciclin domain-containing protein [Candidatus Saccharimonadales bacterium]
MKKLLLAVGVASALFVSVPMSASAHSMDNMDSDWQQAKCERIAERLSNRYADFDQDSEWQVDRIQRLTDRQSDLGCPTGTITETLAANGNFTTLVAAVQAAGLADALSAPGDKTVFAPTDQAFAKLPAGTVESLLQNLPVLTDILTYHVVNGKVDAAAAEELNSAVALNGKELKVSVRDCDLYINDSKVVITDIPTSNGVIHAIDTVLLPPAPATEQ